MDKFFIIIFVLRVHLCSSGDTSTFLTQTVYGFLDFTTTIGNTVMVFSPQSAPSLEIVGKISLPANIIETKPIGSSSFSSENKINPTKSIVHVKSSAGGSHESPKTQVTDYKESVKVTKVDNSLDHGDQNLTESALQIKNNLFKPEYDLLSRQPTEYAEENYRLVNLKPGARNTDRGKKRSETNNSRAESMELKDALTTFRTTSVLEMNESEKYDQALQSSHNTHRNKKPKIYPTSSFHTLRTTVRSESKHNSSPKSQSHRQFTLSNHRQRNKSASPLVSGSVVLAESTSESLSEQATTHTKKKSSRNKSKRRSKGPRHSSAYKSNVPTTTLTSEHLARRSFRPKIQPSSTETDSSTTLYMFKLNRTPGRWQYKSSPKPRVVIRKTINDSPSSPSLSNFTHVPDGVGAIRDQFINENANQNSIYEQGDLEPSGSQNGESVNNVNQVKNQDAFVETLNIEISTPADFTDTYYELATIKSPIIFQAGTLKKTRFIIVTSTFEKILSTKPTPSLNADEPLTENILTSKEDHLSIDGSFTTLMPLHLSNDTETPSLETITESFTVTQTKLKTQVLPVIQDLKNETHYITLLQTYDITNLITTTKTLPPNYGIEFEPSNSFKDFGANLDEAGSEINLELEFGDEDNAEDLNNSKQYADKRFVDIEVPVNNRNASLPAPAAIVKNPDPVQPLDLFNLFNTRVQLPTVVTTSVPVIRLETVWETYVVPIVNGLSTSYRTLSKSVGTVDKTEYKVDTTTVPMPLPAIPQTVNPFLLPVPPNFATVTSSVILQTVATQTNSKILKLTFGARTAYTTIFSTEVVPTLLTQFVTTSLPVQATAAFPGYFPQPYPPFAAYLG